jgi:CheY-like chemotaxis protein
MDNALKKVLVVDDEEIVRVSCLRTLAPQGYEVEAVRDGFEALKLLRDKPFDVIITDFKMPDMDGIEFIDMLRRTAPGARILLVTGYATDDVREQAEAMGASYLAKPFKPDELCEAIEGL